MKHKFFSYLITIALISLAFFLRSQNLIDHAPFDWDQSRDYSQVLRIAQGEYVPLGPVAKGAGGFYLGSLYYYLLYPAFYFLKGNLSALPLTSVIFDSLVAGLIYLFLSKRLGRLQSLILGLFWVVSWFLIDASRVSWNVALVPIWSLLTIVTFQELLDRRRPLWLYLAALLTGFAFHIHVAAIPLIPMLLFIFFTHFRFPLRVWLTALGIGIIPLIPLIHYDLTNNLLNLRLANDMSVYQKSIAAPRLPMLLMALTKLGKVVSGLIANRFADNSWLGAFLLAFSLLSMFSRTTIAKVSGAIIILSFILVVSLRDIGFPEYYFAPAYLAILLLAVHLLTFVWHNFGRLGKLAVGAVLLGIFAINIQAYSPQADSSYNLGVKVQVVQSIKSIGQPVDVILKIQVPGREGGLEYLLHQEGIILDKNSKYKVIITDNVNHGAYYEGEYATDLFRAGQLKTALYVVQ